MLKTDLKVTEQRSGHRSRSGLTAARDCPSTMIDGADGVAGAGGVAYCPFCCSPRESEGVMFFSALVCVSVCLSVTTITKTIADGFVPNFTGRFLEGKGRPSSCFVTIGRAMCK